MRINSVSSVNTSFGYARGIKALKNATPDECAAVYRALGLKQPLSLKKWTPQLDSFGNDVISGNILPGIHVTTKGMTPQQALESVFKIELAKIRGVLKPVHVDKFNL